MSESIQEGFDVFVHDGDKAFGAVRRVHPHGRMEIVVHVEDAGDFTAPLVHRNATAAGTVVHPHDFFGALGCGCFAF